VSVRYWQTAAIVFAVISTDSGGWDRRVTGVGSIFCLMMGGWLTNALIAACVPIAGAGIAVAYWVMLTTVRDEVLAWRYRRARGIRTVKRGKR